MIQLLKILPLLLFFLLSALPCVQATPLDIFVSIPPQKWLAEKVGGDAVRVHVLVKKGQAPHNFSPTPKQVAALYRAKVFFTIDMAFERELVRKISRTTPDILFADSVAGIQKIPILGVGQPQSKDGAGESVLDPHVWLAPDNLQQMARNMASALIERDPEHASVYTMNLQKVCKELATLEKKLSRELALCAGTTFYVFHPAFGYFAHAFGLRQKAVEGSGKSPGPKQLRSLIKQAKQDGIKVIFVQPQFDIKSAHAVASAIGGAVVVLDPLAEDVVTNLTLMAQAIGSFCHGR